VTIADDNTGSANALHKSTDRNLAQNSRILSSPDKDEVEMIEERGEHSALDHEY